jgi:hypothetical protein
MREINHEQILGNIKEMINTLEYDSMRSAGKSKINASTLSDLINLEKHYEAKLNSKKQPNKKEA